ncbi:MAG: hypothetical protein HOJ35_05020, partial [Bdellovibrionales bacterium]|nr:hypothetical protein [Bdellovibrionales bacterium]
MIDATTESIKQNRPFLVIPKIISIKAEFESLGEWEVYLYSDFSRLILDENNHLRPEVANQIHLYLNGSYNNFRIQLDFFSVPLMLGIFTVNKEICFYTARANTELFLLHEVKMDLLQNNTDVENLLLLRSYVEKVVSLKVKKSPTVIEQVTNIYQLPNLLKESKELNLRSYIEKLLIEIKKYRPSWFERISDYGLGMTAQFALIRIHLLKFLAILPSLDYDFKGLEVKRILRESFTRLIKDSEKAKYLKKKGQEKPIPSWMFYLIRIINEVARIFPAGPLAKLVRWSVKFMARRFIAGETIETATESIKELASTNRDVTLDQLGELVVSEKEADQYCDKVIQLIQGFSLHVKPGEKNAAGILKANVSIKVSALCSDFKPEAFEYTYKLVAPRLKKILKEAKKNNVYINIDAEHYSYRNIVFDIYAKILKTDEELKTYTGTGIVLQAYLRDASAHLDQIIELSKERNILMPIRIVKGAYWDAETVEADAHSFNAPEFINKDETDIHFRQLLEKIFQSFPHVQLCLASHNFSDHCYAVALKEKYYPSIPPIEHQCLHMTYEALSTAMTKMGWVVRNYVPVGSLIVGMAYLVRRIMENSSQVGVLTIMRSHNKELNLSSPTELLNEKFKSQQL